MLIYFGGKVMPLSSPSPQSPLFSVSFCSLISLDTSPPDLLYSRASLVFVDGDFRSCALG